MSEHTGRRFWTRRDVLATFLGVPVAMSACRSRDVVSLPAGEIIGASDVIGHRLRDGVRVVPAADAWERVGVLIVGGGVAGLAAARRLLQSGVNDFALIELEKVHGGTSRCGMSKLVQYPWGAHYLPAPMRENRALVSLLDEMDVLDGVDEAGEPVVAEQFLCRDPEERVFYKGHWYEGLYLNAGASADDLAQLAAFRKEIERWVKWRDGRGRRAFAIPLAKSSDDVVLTALDRLTMKQWLDEHGWTSARLHWLVDYACRDDYGATSDATSAWAGIFYFASRITEAGREARPLITWPEGNGHLATYLYEKAREHVRLGLAAAEIIPVERNGKQGVDVVAIDHEGERAFGFHAEQVIFAAPHFSAPYLVRGYAENVERQAAEFQYGAWMVANLFLKDRPREANGFPLAWDNVLYESPSLGYVVATHQRGIDRGATIFTYYYPMCDADARTGRRKLYGMDWKDCADVVLTDLARAHTDIRALTERLDVMRWGHAMVRPSPGFIWGVARQKASREFRGIHFAHTDLSGIALFEEAFYHGNRAAEEIIQKREMRFASVL